MIITTLGEDEMEIDTNTDVILTTVYDNYEFQKGLKTGWGFSCLVNVGSENILFDTGADSMTLLSNMENLGINPKGINKVVLSHMHGDHTSGLTGILERNSDVVVYLPKSFSSSFKEDIKYYGAGFVEIDGPMKISDGLSTTGELGTWIKEQSLMINTEKGLVVITGCAHPGISNIVQKVKELTNKEIYLVLGGFHLSGENDSALKDIIDSFRKLDVKKAAPCHCSGDRTRELFKEEYKDWYIANGVGKILKL